MTQQRDKKGNFEGFLPNECGEHRTTGKRAWCYGDEEWCYPHLPCRGCEIATLRVERDKLEERLVQIYELASGGATTPQEADTK